MFTVQPLSQMDPRWKDNKLGLDRTSTIGKYGCLLTSMTMVANGFGFNPLQVGVARAFLVADTPEEKAAAIERRMTATKRMHAISQRPDGNNAASIMAFSDTREANEEATLYGTPDEICRKIERLQASGVEYLLLNGGGTSRDNLRRFAREVMPHFRNDAPPSTVAAE